jgi:DNA polymerase-3 subunit gamma/tau
MGAGAASSSGNGGGGGRVEPNGGAGAAGGSGIGTGGATSAGGMGAGGNGTGGSGNGTGGSGTGGNGTGGGTQAHAGGGGAMTMAGSIAFALPMAETAPAAPRLAGFRDVAAMVKEQRHAMLHAHLLHSVHLVRFAPPVIELRPEPDAPRDLASKLAALLTDVTGARWTIALSTAEGEPTLAEQGNAADAQRRLSVADHPLVRAIMESFPGARIETVHDATADAYGLPMAPAEISLGEPDMPEFAPPDAEFMDEMEPD